MSVPVVTLLFSEQVRGSGIPMAGAETELLHRERVVRSVWYKMSTATIEN
jgi:hypothetical protein